MERTALLQGSVLLQHFLSSAFLPSIYPRCSSSPPHRSHSFPPHGLFSHTSSTSLLFSTPLIVSTCSLLSCFFTLSPLLFSLVSSSSLVSAPLLFPIFSCLLKLSSFHLFPILPPAFPPIFSTPLLCPCLFFFSLSSILLSSSHHVSFSPHLSGLFSCVFYSFLSCYFSFVFTSPISSPFLTPYCLLFSSHHLSSPEG